jgi:hypothetical protein
MIKGQRLSDMTITIGSIDPCFSCTDRMEIVDLGTGTTRIWRPEGMGAPQFKSSDIKVTVRKKL